jgi:hypothetical protein
MLTADGVVLDGLLTDLQGIQAESMARPQPTVAHPKILECLKILPLGMPNVPTPTVWTVPWVMHEAFSGRGG